MPVLDSVRSIGAGLRRTATDRTSITDAPRFLSRLDYYDLLYAYYHTTAFDDPMSAVWSDYKARYQLHRHHRSPINPFARAVDWYGGRLYQGAWSDDGRPLDDGEPHAIAFHDRDLAERPDLIAAIMQGLNWGNWAILITDWVAMNILYGDTLVEIADEGDGPEGKVSPTIYHPAYVADLDLSPRGNVRSYALQYRVSTNDESYTYRKEVDREWIRTFKNDQPFDYDGGGSVRPNPYGFAPAVWSRFRGREGSVFGQSLLAPVIAKIDNLNDRVSAIGDYVTRFAEQGLIIGSDKSLKDFELGGKGGATIDQTNVSQQRESFRFLKIPGDGKVFPPLHNLGLGDAEWFVKMLTAEIEHDLPEIVYDQQLRDKASLTGPAADRVMGEVRGRYNEAQRNLNAALTLIMRQLVAIGGMRANDGTWGLPSRQTRQQQVFRPFSLDSYTRGELDISIRSVPLLTESISERYQRVALVAPHLPPQEIWRELGRSEEQIYGVDRNGDSLAPPNPPGLLAESEQVQLSAGDTFGRLFDRGAA